MEVELKHIDEFRGLLDHYAPSLETRALLNKRPLVILLGISGSGRNALIDELIASGKYHYVVSDTTRPPKLRNGQLERHGINYNFRSEDEFLKDLKSGEYVEAELIHDQQVSGMSIRELERAFKSDKIPINEFDIGGTEVLADLKPDTKFFFITPPSFDVWMARLQAREMMSEYELRKRVKTAIKIMRSVLMNERFTIVVNDDLHDAADTIDKFVHDGDLRHDMKAHQTVQAFLDDILTKFPEDN